VPGIGSKTGMRQERRRRSGVASGDGGATVGEHLVIEG